MNDIFNQQGICFFLNQKYFLMKTGSIGDLVLGDSRES